MADENNPTPGTGETPTTIVTGTNQDGGSATGTTPSDGLAAALGDGATPPSDSATPPKPEDKPPSGAPESYTAWKLPEGYEFDAGVQEEAGALFKELNLSQEQSQKLIDLYTKHGLRSGDEAINSWLETRREWRESLKNDPVLGKLAGSDGNFGPDSPLVSTINRALTGLQNPKLVSDFKAAMELTGAGDNPAFVRVLHALASQVTEGTSHASGGPVAAAAKRPATAAAAIYPNLPSANSGG